MKRMCLASLAIAAILGAGCNKNDAASSGTAGTSGRVAENVSSRDRDFVKDATRMNAAEVDLSRLAVERGSSSDVKTFAQKMVDDHTAAGAKLNGVAVQNSIDAPSDLDDSHRSVRDTLAGKQGLDFDKDYVDAMVDGHGKFVDMLEARIDKDTLSRWKGEVAKTPDGDTAKIDVKAQMIVPEKSDDPVTQRINAWAADTYPTAYAHLQSAKALKDALKKRATD